jgi:hypothetical protein
MLLVTGDMERETTAGSVDTDDVLLSLLVSALRINPFRLAHLA